MSIAAPEGRSDEEIPKEAMISLGFSIHQALPSACLQSLPFFAVTPYFNRS